MYSLWQQGPAARGNTGAASACRRGVIRYVNKSGGMAQPHKGDRAQIMCRPALDVYAEIRSRASARGMSMSQYAADVLAQHVGRPDLVRDLGDREVLPLAM